MNVKFVRNLENMFEKYIEGFFNNKYSSGLQPVEIAKQLVRQMDDEKTVGISRIYVPNAYVVSLNSIDYERMGSYSQSICQELSLYLVEQAKNEGYTIHGVPLVELVQDDSVGKGKFTIVSRFTEILPEENEGTSNDMQEMQGSDTRVFEKFEFEGLKRASVTGSLTVLEGPDKGLRMDIATTRINIGRRASNELPLTDMNTSRLQAYVVYEEDTHVLYDAKSLNGTYVNEHRIVRKSLEVGDCIKIGNTVILYEVN